ncbi:Chorismate mutase [Apiospora marii]|uniref:Chorismate mutase n=1 Tax=Apiospora marii TaxID=335849 RepID=A0ABR1SB64_9PEZI
MEKVVDHSNPSKALDLSEIRFQLIRLEDTIIFHLIERVQFPLNSTIYKPGAIPIGHEHGDDAGDGQQLSFMDWYLKEQERLQSLIRRYEAPDEYPFFPTALQKPLLKPIAYPKILHPNDVNVNAEIKRFYTEKFLPGVCQQRTERGEAAENYGSTATADIACLQAISRRIHYGKFVAESKFKSDPELYTRLIKAGDTDGIGESITNAAVEKQVLERLRIKAQAYGTDPSSPDKGSGGDTFSKINVEAVVSMYRDFVIPLTKVVEVDYLMQRLEDKEK